MMIFHTIFYSFFIILLLSIAGLFLAPQLPIENNIQLKIVQSGSMEPTINTGGVVLIRGVESYGINDVVTFASAGADIPTTHRIIGTESRAGVTYFITKGDANEEPDAEAIAETAIIGRVLFDLPFVGFILDFARQPLGFALLIGIPALLIIIDEIEKIYAHLRGAKKSTRQTSSKTKIDQVPTPSPTLAVTRVEEKHHDIVRCRIAPQVAVPHTAETPAMVIHNHARLPFVSTSVALLIGSLMCTSTFFIGSTVSYMSDIEKSLQNLFLTPAVDFTASINTSYFGILDGELTGSPALITLTEINGSVPLLYQVQASISAGDPALCAEILATSNSPFAYAGEVSLLTSPENLDFSSPWELAFEADDVNSFSAGTFCDIDILITGKSSSPSWIDEIYLDEETVSVSFVIEESAVPFSAPAFFSGASLNETTEPLPEPDLADPLTPEGETTPPEEPTPPPVLPEDPPDEELEDTLPPSE